ncbi:MAG: hypothetical protein JW982_00535 [Spirochaetes bacterium]|nr:hypothetical protein [Spirochaetota bacterium]
MIDNVLKTAEFAEKGASTALDIITTITTQLEKWKQVRENTGSVIRLLYLEVSKNIELLSILTDSTDNHITCSSDDFMFFLKNFETSVIEMILCGKEETDVFNLLKKKGKIRDDNEILEKQTRKVQKYENVLQAMRFVYIKIDLLKKLSALNEKNNLVKNIRTYERLKNIELRLVLIKNIIGEIDSNTNIS